MCIDKNKEMGACFWLRCGREWSSLICIYLVRISVSIQYLSHSGVHWLRLHSSRWVASGAAPGRLHPIGNGWSNVPVYSHQKESRSRNVHFERNGECASTEDNWSSEKIICPSLSVLSLSSQIFVWTEDIQEQNHESITPQSLWNHTLFGVKVESHAVCLAVKWHIKI